MDLLQDHPSSKKDFFFVFVLFCFVCVFCVKPRFDSKYRVITFNIDLGPREVIYTFVGLPVTRLSLDPDSRLLLSLSLVPLM